MQDDGILDIKTHDYVTIPIDGILVINEQHEQQLEMDDVLILISTWQEDEQIWIE
jgi:hypothetical protein